MKGRGRLFNKGRGKELVWEARKGCEGKGRLFNKGRGKELVWETRKGCEGEGGDWLGVHKYICLCA